MRAVVSCACVFLFLLGTASPGSAGLVITEFLNNPSSNDGTASNSDEWFELYNSGSSSINLSTIRFDDDANASDGVALGGTLASKSYAIIGNRTQSVWEGLFGTLNGALYYQVSPWQVLNNGAGDTITLYSTTTSTNFFTITYGATTDGVSREFTGADPSNASPYGSLWQSATSSPGGSNGDFHSAGRSNITTAPEPASMILVGLSSLYVAAMVRRQRSAARPAAMAA